MYSIHGYGVMVADRRADLYADALRRSVRPGSVVVDVGSGTGTWALYACTLGARRVFAIEPGDVIGLAIEAARANGFDDRITFIQRTVSRAAIDEPADVVVADLRAVLPLTGANLAGMIDARRFLTPAGVLMPRRDTLWVAVVHAPAAHRAGVGPWDERCFGLDYAAARRAAVSLPRKERFEPADLVTPASTWAELDYRTLAGTSVSGRAQLAVHQAQVAHGLAVWFESDLVDEIRLSNRPGDPPLLYGQSFFSWPDPVTLEAGDRVDVRLRAARAGRDYIIAWDTVVTAGGSGRERARFTQSTFDALPLSLAALRRRGADVVISPGPERDVERFVLEAFDGRRSYGEIADALMAHFPHRFAARAEALARVTDVGLRVTADGEEHLSRD